MKGHEQSEPVDEIIPADRAGENTGLRATDEARPIHFLFPVMVSFSGETFVMSDLTARLSTRGIILPLEKGRALPQGARVSLTFRISRWEDPLAIQGEVVRSASSGTAEEDDPPGIDIKFLDLSDEDRKRLRRLSEEAKDASMVEAIRRVVREGGRSLFEEIRRRSADQKVILATCAKGEEVDVLIRDGNPSVLLRLLQNPRLNTPQVLLILQDPSLPARVLAAVRRNARWSSLEEIRVQICLHHNTPLQDALTLIPKLSIPSLQVVAGNRVLRSQIRTKARQVLGPAK
jgi:hypothetical protein